MAVPQKNETEGNLIVAGMDTRSLLIFLGIGLLAGFLASLIVGGGGLITYLISGVIGSFVGGYLFSALKINLGIKNAVLNQIVTSTIGAIIVVIVARLIAG
jgi:uncharacterized membrane protein YeaQ/YmgE (transglycosylase-associated protein family)